MELGEMEFTYRGTWPTVWSPDDCHCAGEDQKAGYLRVFCANTGRQKIEFWVKAGWFSSGIQISWSPDGKLVSTIRPTELCIYDAENWEIKFKSTMPANPFSSRRVTHFSWNPDGKSFAFMTGDELHILNSDSFEGIRNQVCRIKDYSRTRHLMWNPQGSRLVIGHSNHLFSGQSQIIDTTDGTIEAVLPVCSSKLCWSSDGQSLKSADGNIRIWNAMNWALEKEINIQKGYEGIWSPVGDQLAARYKKMVVIYNVRSGEEQMLLHPEGKPRAMAWSPDGNRLASVWGGFWSAGSIKVSNSKTWETEWVLDGYTGEGPHFSWSPDSQLIASYGTQDPSIRFWSAVSKKEIGLIHDRAWNRDRIPQFRWNLQWRQDSRRLTIGNQSWKITR